MGESPLLCPFCGQRETERCVIEGRRLIVFPCMFSPLVDVNIPEESLQEYLDQRYRDKETFLRKQCAGLHMTMVVRENAI
jgi:sarcosine oxidase delta subunit